MYPISKASEKAHEKGLCIQADHMCAIFKSPEAGADIVTAEEQYQIELWDLIWNDGTTDALIKRMPGPSWSDKDKLANVVLSLHCRRTYIRKEKQSQICSIKAGMLQTCIYLDSRQMGCRNAKQSISHYAAQLIDIIPRISCSSKALL